MIESKFTPGPWYISIDSRNCPSVRSKGGYICFAPSINNYGDPLRYMDEATEGQANARLIAAAPNMYEALKEVLRYSSGAAQTPHEVSESLVWFAKVKEQINSAISKAEGKA